MLIFQSRTLEFSSFQSRSETVLEIFQNRPKIASKPSQIRPIFYVLLFDVFSGFLSYIYIYITLY